jgi:carbon starvation protein CstA
MTVSVSLWISTHSLVHRDGADVMIPLVPLIGGTITSVIYVLLTYCFEMTKQHVKNKGKIDLIDATLNIISLSVGVRVAQTLSLMLF